MHANVHAIEGLHAHPGVCACTCMQSVHAILMHLLDCSSSSSSTIIVLFARQKAFDAEAEREKREERWKGKKGKGGMCHENSQACSSSSAARGGGIGTTLSVVVRLGSTALSRRSL